MRTRRLSLLLVSGLLACGASEPNKPEVKQPQAAATTPEPTPTSPSVSPEAAVTAAQSINAFAVDLHRALAKRPGDIFVSPASIALAFAMVHAGARGATQQEIGRVFHLRGDTSKLHADLAGTLKAWAEPIEGQEFAVANRLYGERSVAFEKSYLDLTRSVFAAPLELVDFKTAAEPARERINAWVAGQTRDKIKDLIPGGALDQNVRLVAVNAVYFKGTWVEQFERGMTAAAPFHAPSGDRTVQMMHRSDSYRLAVAPGLKLLELPYHGDRFALVVVLPDARDGLAAIEGSLDAATLAGWISGATTRPVNVKLPRFRIEPGAGLLLREVLSGLGMAGSFGGGADLTGMAPASEGIYISEAIHKAFIAVDESGTEAAAATAVMTKGGGPPPAAPPIEFTADHPFLFLIRDVKTDAIVFMGRLAEPKA